MIRQAIPMLARRLALGCWLGMLLGLAPSVRAQAQADPADEPRMHTGDTWVDAQLRDIGLYAARYRDAFVDELVRYHGAPRGGVQQWLARPDWQAGEVYFACSIANVLARPCSEVVALRQQPDGPAGWQAVLDDLDVDTRSDAFRRVKRGILFSYARWARPIEPDAALRRMLADEARASATPAAKAGKAKKSAH